MKKNVMWAWIVIILVLMIIAGLGIYKFNLTNDDIIIACTQEAKLCPDGSAVGRTGPNCEFDACPQSKSNFTEADARIIAEKTCIKGGESLAPWYYNENSKTWWFDANLNATKEGCNPACVVSEETKQAEINWRCTGLIKPKWSSENIEQLFAEKYPKYAKTLTVSINKETQNHIRGSIIFETGAPGGNFLATKIDDKWQIVFDGNGQIPCNLSMYEFPADMLSDCAQ